MEYKPTFKKNNSSNKDKLRNVKIKEKRNHLHKKEKSKSSSNEKEKKENYIRNERDYSKHLMQEIIQNKYLYKVKDFIRDWYLDQDVGDEEFWNLISLNSHSIFLFFDKKHYRIIQNYDYGNILINPNGGIISELLLEIMFDNIKKTNHINGWRNICNYGNKNVINILEKNIDKYRDEYGFYYDILYKALCMNSNATHIIKYYYDSFFSEDCLEELCQNTDPEALSLVEPFIKKLDIHDPSYKPLFYSSFRSVPCYLSLSSNPSAIPVIKQFYNIYETMMPIYRNPNAIDIIEKYIELPFDNEIDEDEYDDYDDMPSFEVDSLSSNCNAIHLIENHIKYIDFEKLASNENGMDLLEKNLEFVKCNYFPYGNCNPSQCKNSPFPEKCRRDLFKQNLCSNPNSIEFLKKYPEYLCTKILTNPSIFEINWYYLKSKFNYISYKEEEIINKYSNKEIESIEPFILLKLKKDYVTQREIEEIIDIYKKNKKYLSENELVMQLTTERLIKAVYSPHRVSRNLLLYNYDICQDIYCEDD